MKSKCITTYIAYGVLCHLIALCRDGTLVAEKVCSTNARYTREWDEIGVASARAPSDRFRARRIVETGAVLVTCRLYTRFSIA